MTFRVSKYSYRTGLASVCFLSKKRKRTFNTWYILFYFCSVELTLSFFFVCPTAYFFLCVGVVFLLLALAGLVPFLPGRRTVTCSRPPEQRVDSPHPRTS